MDKMIFCDIDGCLVPTSNNLEIMTLNNIRNTINDTKKKNFSFSLCTGRSAPYVELISSILDITELCICENGSYLYNPISKTIKKLITHNDLDAILNLKKLLVFESLVGNNFHIELGKDMSISLNPSKNSTIEVLYNYIRGKVNENFNITYSSTAVDIIAKNTSKGSALEYILNRTKTVKETYGIGDSMGDISFLKKVDYSASPQNASKEVKRQVSYVSKNSYGAGVIDIMNEIIKK